MSKEIQKDEYYLPGGLGEVKIASSGTVHEITKAESNSADGSVKLTITPQEFHRLYWNITQDAEFEVLQPKQLPEVNPSNK